MLLAVALGRAIAVLSVTRLRDAGFEMVWVASPRVHRVARGSVLRIEAEVRNRSHEGVRCLRLRPIASSMLAAAVEPTTLRLPSATSAIVTVTVRANRVGRHGIHGLALEVGGTPLGSEAPFEVPLLFASPLGVEVFPRDLAALTGSPRGGRARRPSEMGRPTPLAGEGDQLRELRDHAPGDPFRRIAWKASARRGRLLVREMERDDRDVVWIIVDASVELLAGEPGNSPLDRVIEEAADRASRNLRRGDRVGLVVAASRLHAWVEPNEGARQGAAIASALAGAASCVDADRSELDENEVAQRIAEHARPLDSRGFADLPNMGMGDLDALARRATLLRARAPFLPPPLFAHTPREQELRSYLAAFGIESPPRLQGERDKTETVLAQVFEKLVTHKPRSSLLYVWALPPSRTQATARAIARLRARSIEVRWRVPPLDAGIGADPDRRSAVAGVVDEAVRARARAMMLRGERQLRHLGVRLLATRGTAKVGP
jgi:uncharacterized protein (DUF58 family)